MNYDKKRFNDYSLYLVTDENCRRRPLAKSSKQRFMRVTVVQYRATCTGTRPMIKDALEIAFFVHAHNNPLIIMIAWISLLPSEQMNTYRAGGYACFSRRKIIGAEKLLGVSEKILLRHVPQCRKVLITTLPSDYATPQTYARIVRYPGIAGNRRSARFRLLRSAA